MNRPKYKRCDSCGRNEHKVAVRHRASGRHLATAETVSGYCTSCFADDFVKRPWQEKSSIEFLIEKGATVVYDRRGKAARNRNPIPAEMQPGYTPPRATRESETGRRLWAACGHPAELDIDENCYVCHEAV